MLMKAKNVVTKNVLAGSSIWIDTPQWLEWLSINSAFRYEAQGTNFNCNKKANGKWYASKKIYATNGCKLIALYIGGDEDCTLERLQGIAEKFSLDWADFWRWYHGSERKESKKSKSKVRQKYITSPDLQGELQRLQLALEEMTSDRDRQLIRIAELQNRMHDEIKKAIGHQGKQLARLKQKSKLNKVIIHAG